jgi:hypothetical protein
MVCWKLDSPLEQVAAGTPLHNQRGQFPLKGRHFQKVEEIQCAVTRELNILKTAFLEGMKKLKERAKKYIDQGGMYFEE